ncbi:hypothetical protein XCR1_1320006 [Xenorhabdus cabanillasii JM26]|uniref:Uncharacterized protein n=1 Tax=Xenorhabdus cabanillasii JM26 TaxID=1427517 RepID=W1IS14_9GAMM|nr:hypothetical protein XCR1_1320006 [Xenorhabdus cabanillasii JM26]
MIMIFSIVLFLAVNYFCIVFFYLAMGAIFIYMLNVFYNTVTNKMFEFLFGNNRYYHK